MERRERVVIVGVGALATCIIAGLFVYLFVGYLAHRGGVLETASFVLAALGIGYLVVCAVRLVWRRRSGRVRSS